MTADTDRPNRHVDPAAQSDMDEALSWFDAMRQAGGANVTSANHPKPLTPSRPPSSNLPAWMRRDMARVRAAVQNQPATETLPESETDRLDWFDSFATDLGAAVEEPTHQWQNPDLDRRTGDPISRAKTHVYGAEVPDDAEADKVDTGTADEPPRPRSAEELLSEIPDDPDDIVGYLERMASDDELEDLFGDETAPPDSATDEPITKRGASAAELAETEGALSWVEALVDDGMGDDTPQPDTTPPDGDNPLAWLEALEKERSGVEERLSAEARASKPRAISGPFAAKRTQALDAAKDGDPAAAAVQYQALLDDGADVDTIIDDLRAATNAFPTAAPLYGALGDAYARKGDAKRAAKAYRDEVRYRDAA